MKHVAGEVVAALLVVGSQEFLDFVQTLFIDGEVGDLHFLLLPLLPRGAVGSDALSMDLIIYTQN